MNGLLFVITAPSGAGKSSLIDALLKDDPLLRLSVSYTTRAPRPGEVNGREYHFVDDRTFLAMLERGEFLESAEVHGNRYGTSQAVIREALARGQDLVLEIDWQGAQQVRGLFHGSIGIFVLPPSVEELERRLTGRGQDSAEIIARRTAAALAEMRHVSEFDYVIINNKLPEAIEDLQTVVRSIRLRYASQLDRHRALFAFLEHNA